MNNWDFYEITSVSIQHGVKMRGTIRKFSIENNIPLLIENASDKDNVVRFALQDDKSLPELTEFVSTIVENPSIQKSVIKRNKSSSF